MTCLSMALTFNANVPRGTNATSKPFSIIDLIIDYREDDWLDLSPIKCLL